jgi:hypothetical protein
MYKNTYHYEKDDIDAVNPVNWLQQYKSTFYTNSNTEFYKVNELPLGSDDKVNKRIEEWEDLLNINYITHQDLLDKLD